MITVQERITSKVPGITSVFVGFPFNKELFNEMHRLPCSNYSKRTKLWEVPIKYLAQTLDILCQYDEVDLQLCDVHFEEDIHYNLSKYKTKPFPYQEEGIQFGLNNDTFLLLDPPGLGKTLQLTYIAEELKRRENLKHCLIICGINTLKTNWKKEIQRHSKLDCTILGEKVTKRGKVVYGGIADRLKQLEKPIKEFFVIVNIETLREPKIIEKILNGKNKFDMIVVDEIHKCKNASSLQGANLLKLTKAKHRIGATGTLLMNNPLDCYVPLKWIDADRSTQGNFKKYYCVYGGQFGTEFMGYRNLETLKKQLDLFSLRRPKSLLNLPDKNIINEYVDMSDQQRKFYENVSSGVRDEVDKVELKPNVVLGMVMRLRQATACPSILTTQNIPSAKIDRVCDLVDEITSDGHKVVIFSTFKETVGVLQDRLSGYKPLIGTGDIDDEIISHNVDIFQKDTDRKVFIGTWQKCGTGLTLTAATHMIFVDIPWTAAAFEQACDRIYRIGTKEPVFIYNLITTDTIDECVQTIMEDKEALSDYVIDNIITQKSLASLQKYIEELKD